MASHSRTIVHTVMANTWVRCFSLFLILSVFYQAVGVESWREGYVGFDFEVFLQAAEDLSAGESPYSKEIFYGEDPPDPDRVAGVYVYPAFFARLLVPLTHLSPFSAKMVFVLAAYGIVLYLLLPKPKSMWESIRTGGPFWIPIFIPFCFLFSWGPLIENLRFGQSNLLALALFCAAWSVSRGTETRGEFLAGLFIGLAAMIKLTPLLIVPFFMVTFRWAALLGIGLGAGIAILLSGWPATVEFFTHILPVVATLEDASRGIALGDVLDRHVPGSPGKWALACLYFAILARVFRNRKQIHLDRLVLLGAFLPTVFAGLWYHHYALALLALVAIVPGRMEGLWEKRRERKSAGAVFQLTLLGISLLMGFYYWPPVRTILTGRGGEPLVTGLELFVIGHAIAFLMLLPQLIEPNERNRSGNRNED